MSNDKRVTHGCQVAKFMQLRICKENKNIPYFCMSKIIKYNVKQI